MPFLLVACPKKFAIEWILYRQTFFSNFRDDLWYFTSVNWLDDNSVIITWMDRLQKEAIVSKCSGPDYQCEKVGSIV